MLTKLDHLLLAIPQGSEDLCRPFYVELLGMDEQVKPPSLTGRGGLWLRSGSIELHLGVEKDFRAARKAHPAFGVRDLDGLSKRLASSGHDVIWDEEVEAVRRFFSYDPVGNRIEFIEDKPASR